jgi:hypothetical protein
MSDGSDDGKYIGKDKDGSNRGLFRISPELQGISQPLGYLMTRPIFEPASLLLQARSVSTWTVCLMSTLKVRIEVYTRQITRRHVPEHQA